MLQFPPIPDCKKYTEGSDLTLEALTMQKAFTKQKLCSDDDRILAECAEFYEHAFTYLNVGIAPDIKASKTMKGGIEGRDETLEKRSPFRITFQSKLLTRTTTVFQSAPVTFGAH